jgi:hypothetical protein
MAQNVLAWKCNCKSLNDIDLFSKSPDLYYKGKPQKSTIFGRILTISYAIIYAAFFIYKIIRMALKIDVSFIETQTWTGEIPSLKLNNNHFYGGFALLNPLLMKPFIDESIYYVEATFVTGKKKDSQSDFEWDYKPLEVEPCQLEKFGEDFRELFKGKLDGLYCLKDVDVTIQGHTTLDAYSYFYVEFFPCVNGKRNRNNCADINIVKAILDRTGLMVKMEDIELTPQNYKNPIQVRTRELTAPVMDSLYNNIQAYFHIIDIKTDNDIIGLGFDGLSNKIQEKHFKYDVTFMVNSMNTEEKLPTNTGEAYCNIQLQLTEQMISIERTYTKLIEVLGDVGGLMEFVFSFFKIISIFITEALYEKGLINHLFTFDLDRKIIELKNPNKNKIMNFPKDHEEISPFSYKLSSELLIYGKEDIHRNNNIALKNESENRINNELLSFSQRPTIDRHKMKAKRKINKRRSPPITNDVINKDSEDIKRQNLVRNNLRNENDFVKIYNNNDDLYDKNKEFEGKNNKISKISFNWVGLYICLLCTRKRKNIKNILLDEGMELFSEKLDVINIFRQLMKIENNKHFNNELIPILMSDECKLKLQKFK